MNKPRGYPTANLLPSGKVLIAGGATNGLSSDIHSNAELFVTAPLPVTNIFLTGPIRLPGGAFRFQFTNSPDASFTALAATNPALPSSSWTVLGAPTQTVSGEFEFTDSQATNFLYRFYRVRSP
jgi:hypothetical protein